MLPASQVLQLLARYYGPQHWWPAESSLEIAVGAILVQRTTWKNTELALAQLKATNLLSLEGILASSQSQLEQAIRPAGFFRTKARYLRNFAEFVLGEGGLDRLAGLATAALHLRILSVVGIGEETAAAILLYLFARPVWVSDAYSRRLIARLSGLKSATMIDEAACLAVLVSGQKTAELQELHALIVAHGQQHCRPVPECRGCPLRTHCLMGLQA